MAGPFNRVRVANRLDDRDFAEPYAGGAGAAPTLLFRDEVPAIHINDVDEAVSDIWWAILERTGLSAEDGIDFVQRLASDDAFFFIDPPYFGKGPMLYLNALDPPYHAALAEVLRTLEDSPCGALHGFGPAYSDPPQVAGECTRRSISLRIPTDADHRFQWMPIILE